MPADARKFVAQLKSNPGKYFYGSAGISTSFLGVELFKEAFGVQATNVSYKGAGESVHGVVGDQVQFIIASLGVGQALAQAGKIRAIAVMANERLAGGPDIPTLPARKSTRL